MKEVRLLGSKGSISWRYTGKALQLKIPAAIRRNNGLKQAATFRIDL